MRGFSMPQMPIPGPRRLLAAALLAGGLLAGGPLVVGLPLGGPAFAQQAGTRPSLRDLDMNAVPPLDLAGVYKVQQLLRARGFDPVKVDGVMGPLTRAAIGGFQERYGIRSRPEVEIDNQTLFALGAVELAGPGSR